MILGSGEATHQPERTLMLHHPIAEPVLHRATYLPRAVHRRAHPRPAARPAPAAVGAQHGTARQGALLSPTALPTALPTGLLTGLAAPGWTSVLLSSGVNRHGVQVTVSALVWDTDPLAL